MALRNHFVLVFNRDYPLLKSEKNHYGLRKPTSYMPNSMVPRKSLLKQYSQCYNSADCSCPPFLEARVLPWRHLLCLVYPVFPSIWHGLLFLAHLSGAAVEELEGENKKPCRDNSHAWWEGEDTAKTEHNVQSKHVGVEPKHTKTEAVASNKSGPKFPRNSDTVVKLVTHSQKLYPFPALNL